MNYSINNEYVADINSASIQQRIGDAKRAAGEFLSTFLDLHLDNDLVIETAYEKAITTGLLDQAADIRQLIFGNRTTTYGVSYISDSCVGGCTYCPIRRDSTDAETGRPIKRRTLTLEEFIADTSEIIADGHSHICFLTGDGSLTHSHPEKLIPYLQAMNGLNGLKEVILNVTPQTTDTFRAWRAAAPDKSMQFRVFQETYDTEIYISKHPFGPKTDYQFRRESQTRAMEAGFDNYGFGVLLGLSPHFLKEIEALRKHTEEMKEKWQKPPARVCLPTANELAGVNNVEKQHYVSVKAVELAYAIARLAMPETSIVSSERDTPDVLAMLDRYATNRTVDVQPSVGGNLAQNDKKNILLKQSTVFPIDPETAQKDYTARGYELVFNY